MKYNSLQRLLTALACLGMACPQIAWARGPIEAPQDVALRAGGVLVGQVLDQQGAASAGSIVSIQQDEQEIVRTATDANGIFAARGLRGGQYRIVTSDGEHMCRLWAPNTAPPAATDAVVLVSGQDVVRGQYTWGQTTGGQWLDWVRSHPYITAGIVAAAVATPLALAAADDDNNGPSS